MKLSLRAFLPSSNCKLQINKATRRKTRTLLRRLKHASVVFLIILSMLLNQTYATFTLQVSRTLPPAPVRLGAGQLTYAYVALADALKGVFTDACGFLMKTCFGSSAHTSLSPAGRPHPWQLGIPLNPHSTLNAATGNVFTEVPIVSWKSVGRPISFSLFHNTLGDDAGVLILPEGWSHSYSQHVTYDQGEDEWTLFTAEGEKIKFTHMNDVPVFLDWAEDAYEAPPGYFMWLAPHEFDE
ncbi:MAG: hypothetical protein IPK83_14420, partial [Planctomycetes bacterium]|nr:hypothetical protein [Planctomycetota bacterium]